MHSYSFLVLLRPSPIFFNTMRLFLAGIVIVIGANVLHSIVTSDTVERLKERNTQYEQLLNQ